MSKINFKTEPVAIITVLYGVISTVLEAQTDAGVETTDWVQLGILGAAALAIRALVFAAESVDDIVGYIVSIAKDKTGVDLSEDV